MTEPGVGGSIDAEAAPRCYRHPDRETYISCVRCGRPICPECMRPASVGFQCPEEIKEAARTVRTPRTAFGGRVTTGGTVTRALIGVNVAVFVVMVASGTGFLNGNPSLLFTHLADLPGRLVVVHNGTQTVLGGVANGDWYRLVTSMFLHFGIVHIALNMYVLFLVGPTLENALGRWRFLLLYLIAGIGGSVAAFLFGSVTEIGAGASGAIFGLFGAYYIVARRLGAETGPIVATIALNVVLSFAISNIDIRAHLGGLVVGTAVGAVFAYAPRGPQRTVIQLCGSLAILAVVLVAAVLHATTIRHDERNQPVNGVRLSVGAPPAGPPAAPAPLQ